MGGVVTTFFLHVRCVGWGCLLQRPARLRTRGRRSAQSPLESRDRLGVAYPIRYGVALLSVAKEITAVYYHDLRRGRKVYARGSGVNLSVRGHGSYGAHFGVTNYLLLATTSICN